MLSKITRHKRTKIVWFGVMKIVVEFSVGGGFPTSWMYWMPLCVLSIQLKYTFNSVLSKSYFNFWKRKKKYCCTCVWRSTSINKDKCNNSLWNLLVGRALGLSLFTSTLYLSWFFPFSILFYSLRHKKCNGLWFPWVMFYWLISTCFKWFKICECAWVVH